MMISVGDGMICNVFYIYGQAVLGICRTKRKQIVIIATAAITTSLRVSCKTPMLASHQLQLLEEYAFSMRVLSQTR
jgi:hypothetical protein